MSSALRQWRMRAQQSAAGRADVLFATEGMAHARSERVSRPFVSLRRTYAVKGAGRGLTGGLHDGLQVTTDVSMLTGPAVQFCAASITCASFPSLCTVQVFLYPLSLI